MRMARIALLAGISLLAGFSLKGELLYWMVDENSTAGQYDFAYAGVKDVTSGDYLDYATEDGVVEWPGAWQVDRGAFADGGVYGSLGDDVSGHSFLIELYNDAGAFLASSEMKAYGELASYIARSGVEREKLTPWNGGTFAVPEPTSGLMVLLGTALLALMRNRA